MPRRPVAMLRDQTGAFTHKGLLFHQSQRRTTHLLLLPNSHLSKISLQLALLSGANGNLDAILLEQLLEDGLTVKAVLRSFANFKQFLEQIYPHEAVNGKFHFTEIPDTNNDGVLTHPQKCICNHFHVATPLSSSDSRATMIEPT